MSIRHDWYQTEIYVKVTVLLKNAADKNYNVKIEPDRVEMTADDYQLSLNLFKTIDAEKSTHKAFPSKVEITLYKLVGERWDSLEKKVEEVKAAPLATVNTKNWDKLAKEIDEKDPDDPQGEAALQALFQKIYMESDPEVRKAMNKSYSESAGTVLSTNWKEVSEKKVDVKPVDGTEFKSWDK